MYRLIAVARLEFLNDRQLEESFDGKNFDWEIHKFNKEGKSIQHVYIGNGSKYDDSIGMAAELVELLNTENDQEPDV